MLSYSAYKIVHLTGIFLLFCALGGLSSLSAKGALAEGGPARKFASAAHGLSLIIVLVGGMGLLARLGMNGPWPMWVWLKIALWFVMGALIIVIRRAGTKAGILLFLFPLLGALAAFLAVYKPGSGPQ